MGNLVDRFNEPLPRWVEDVDREACAKLSASAFARECRSGNVSVIRELIFRFWPFVDAFPKMINQGCLHLLKEDLFRSHGLELIGLFRAGFELLLGIEKDEENHRSLWLKTADALGLSYGELERTPSAEVRAINDSVGEETDPSTMLLRFVAVEIVAESVSKDFLSSKNFVSALGEQGVHWFRVHVAHNGITHEELALHLAFSLYDDELNKDRVNAVVQPVVDLFIMAANKCAELATLKQATQQLCS
jgi:pyrroloquinoline quinone (PQQ) biosynthesis protein C